MSKKLDDLDLSFRPKVVEFLARSVEIEIPLKIITTRRTATEQAEKVRAGLSWTMKSKHLEGLAIDIVPIEVLDKPNWEPENPVWQELGKLGESLGLKWGIVKNGKHLDLGHFELVEET